MDYFLLECIEHCGGVSPVFFRRFVSLLNFQRASPQFDLLNSLVSGTHSALWRSGNSEYRYLWTFLLFYPWCRCLGPILLHYELKANAGHCGFGAPVFSTPATTITPTISASIRNSWNVIEDEDTSISTRNSSLCLSLVFRMQAFLWRSVISFPSGVVVLVLNIQTVPSHYDLLSIWCVDCIVNIVERSVIIFLQVLWFGY